MADWGDYTRVAVSSASYRNQGIKIYPHKRSPWRVDFEFTNTMGSILYVKVYTHDTHLYILVVPAPQVRKVKSFSQCCIGAASGSFLVSPDGRTSRSPWSCRRSSARPESSAH